MRNSRIRSLATLLALSLLAAACGGGDDDSQVGAGDPGTEATAQADTGGATDEGGDTSADQADGAAADAADTTAPAEAPPAESAGNGVLIADLCSGNQPIDGAVSLDDLVSYELLSSPNATVEGSGTNDAVAYNDFGFLCNITEQVDGGENFMTIGLSAGSGTWDSTVEFSDATPERMGELDVILTGQFSAPLVMLSTDDAGNQDSLFVNWFPADDDRLEPDELTRVLRPLAEAIAANTTVDIPRVDAPATPDWFACDDATGGVVGVEPSALFAAAGGDPAKDLEVNQDTVASFGFTECVVRPVTGFLPLTQIRVQNPDEVLQDSVATYLDSWSDATADTIAGIDVAIRIDSSDGYVFAVIGEVPTEISLRTDGNDNDNDTVAPNLRVIAELVLTNAS